MIFSKVFKSNPISTFELVLSSGGNDLVAFGTGSIINGSIKLFLDKSIAIKSIRVVFKCEEWDQKKPPSTLFSVESCIWSQEQQELLETGSHIYLFAIQLPSSVNYPPTIRDAYLGHRIEYSLQGHLDYFDASTKYTSIVPLTYLPLVTFDDHSMHYSKREKTIQIQDKIQVTAKLANPSSCPGDLCTVRVTTHNQSTQNINQVHILLFSTATSLASNQHPDLPLSGPSYRHKQRQILHESYFVSIPKHSRDVTTICPFKIPAICVPTTQCHFGKYIDITYEVVIILPTAGININYQDGSIITHPHAIRLPLVITTVPYSSSLPPKLQIPFVNEKNTDVPTFIKSNELPSPIEQHSPGIWSPGSPMTLTVGDDFIEDGLLLPPAQQDDTGHLMVPAPMTNAVQRSVSVHSNSYS